MLNFEIYDTYIPKQKFDSDEGQNIEQWSFRMADVSNIKINKLSNVKIYKCNLTRVTTIEK